MARLVAMVAGLLVLLGLGGESQANDNPLSPASEQEAKGGKGKANKPTVKELETVSHKLGKLDWALMVLSRQKPREKLTGEEMAEFKQAMKVFRERAKQARAVKKRADEVIEKMKRLEKRGSERQSQLTDEPIVSSEPVIMEARTVLVDAREQLNLLAIQQLQNRLTEQLSAMSNMASRSHQTAMSIIQNMR